MTTWFMDGPKHGYKTQKKTIAKKDATAVPVYSFFATLINIMVENTLLSASYYTFLYTHYEFCQLTAYYNQT